MTAALNRHCPGGHGSKNQLRMSSMRLPSSLADAMMPLAVPGRPGQRASNHSMNSHHTPPHRMDGIGRRVHTVALPTSSSPSPGM